MENNNKNKNENGKKSLMPIYLLMVLKENSSKEHPLTRTEIAEKLEKLAGIEINDDNRKYIPRVIKTLSESFKGCIEEIKGKKGTPSQWYLNPAYCPLSSGCVFSFEEVNMLADMIDSSQIIGDKCTKAMIDNLIGSLDEQNKKKLTSKFYKSGAPKSQNQPLLQIKEEVERAIEEYKKLSFIYSDGGKRKKFTVIPVSLQITAEGDAFLEAFYNNNSYKFYVDKMSDLEIEQVIAEPAVNDEVDLETERVKLEKSVRLDNLFFNLRDINYAITNRQRITFSYMQYAVKGSKLVLAEKANVETYPINTVWKNGKYYLLGIDVPNNNKPCFYRLDFMKNLRFCGTLDFMERRNLGNLDDKDKREYTETRPFMVDGFTKMGVRFLIEEEALEKVADAFGDKAVPCGKVWGYQTAGKNSKLLAEKYPELDFSTYLGLSHHKQYVEVCVTTTEEDALYFALQNAGHGVELLAPQNLRQKLLEIAKQLEKRYSKVKQ
jgi:predicted DNA-binding transcriptional regulator YafY